MECGENIDPVFHFSNIPSRAGRKLFDASFENEQSLLKRGEGSMLTKEENEFLTRVGPGTPAGEMLRRYWHPIAFIQELKNRPIRRRILGEDLVLFRDEQNRLGLLALRCSHRGTSLEFGHLEDGGLRCCYHGWLYDV